MSNKILDQIEHVIVTGQNRANRKNLDFTISAHAEEIPATPAIFQHKVRAELRVYFEQYLDADASVDQRQMVRERAKQAIARQLYGDVVNDLLDLREMIWEEGQFDPPYLDKLGVIIERLSGYMERFE